MKTIGYVLLAVLLVAAVPCSAGAASIGIRPDQFRPMDPSNPYNYQEPAHVSGDGGTAKYFAVISLPVGRTITELIFYHRGVLGSRSDCYLYRTQFRQYSDQVTGISTAVGTGDNVIEVDTETILRPLVKADFTYHVEVTVPSGNHIHGVKINYE